MATIIDALVVKLGLDSSDFEKGQKQTQEGLKKVKSDSTDTAKVMQEQGKKAGAFFSSIRNELLALVGISLSIKGFKDLIIGTANSMATLGRSAAPLNMSARQLDAWQHVAQATGGTAEGLTGSMQSLSDSIHAFSMGKGGEQAIATLGSLGISAKDAQGKMKGVGDIYVEVAQKFKDKKLSIGAARQFGMGLGMDSATVNMLMEGPEKVQKLYQDMYKNSGVTDAAVERSKRFQEQWAKIDQTFQSVREKLFTALIPHIDKLLILLDKFATWVGSHQEEINAFFTSTATEFSNIVEAVGGIENALKLLLLFVAGKWLSGMLGAVGRVSGALGGIPALVTVAGGYVAAIAGNEVIERIKALSEGREYDQIQGHSAEMSELERLKRRNWAVNNPNTPYPEGEPVQHAQAAKATGKGKALLDWMSGQFGKLEAQYGLPTGLLRSVATTESGGNQYAISGAGAKGLFQFMDPTARDMGLKGNDVYDPEKSANAAAKYLSQLLKATGGDLSKALGAYNWGIGNVQKKGLGNAPLETLNYIPKVLSGMPMGAQVGAQRFANNTNNNQTSSTTSTEISIGKIDVLTQATDATGIARDLGGQIRRNGLVAAANGGFS
ncbi:transglycosylase SLT domain-containing protein [Yersinia sp. 2545 StPb PI]|uniref:transglycosylase SLT domain-containing protein n=1 Tax=Yersinia sp. 2545 StPb PI TaxID=3117410 RepID=UPI003FA42196